MKPYQFFVPVQQGTPPQRFDVMLDTGSSLSWFQTQMLHVQSYQPETISVRYTEGIITTQLVSDMMVLGSNIEIPINNSNSGNADNSGTRASTIARNNTALEANNSTVLEFNASSQPIWPSAAFRGHTHVWIDK
jgi:hypothetical protein